jgi:guanyl-specific ribonuclease Sa
VRSAERVDRKASPDVAAPEQAAPVSSGVGSVLALQRKAGNRATTAALSQVHRKIAKSTDPAEGPKFAIPDTSLAGDAKAAADKAAGIIRAKGRNPWPQRGWKWGVTHENREGKLPGKPGAGAAEGYKEYYISQKADETVFDGQARMVAGKGEIFHTNNHYRSFTHYGSL